jgi:predicted metal-dependent phosphoesterase TrpH
MLSADLHVHTTYSGDFSTPEQILRMAAKRGLNAIAITDHDTIKGALEAATIAQQNPNLPTVIIGEEISSQDGHILGLFLQERVPPGLSAAATVAAIQAQDGLAIAAHPFWRVGLSSLGGALVDQVPFDGIEVVNGVPVPSMMRANALADRYQRESHLAATGGSDAHHALAVGWSHTRFAGTSALDLRNALAKRATLPARLPINPLDFARYALAGVRRHPRGLFRIAF